jgi:hypothetical protein
MPQATKWHSLLIVILAATSGAQASDTARDLYVRELKATEKLVDLQRREAPEAEIAVARRELLEAVKVEAAFYAEARGNDPRVLGCEAARLWTEIQARPELSSERKALVHELSLNYLGALLNGEALRARERNEQPRELFRMVAFSDKLPDYHPLFLGELLFGLAGAGSGVIASFAAFHDSPGAAFFFAIPLIYVGGGVTILVYKGITFAANGLLNLAFNNRLVDGWRKSRAGEKAYRTFISDYFSELEGVRKRSLAKTCEQLMVLR